jgi:hypothetical protein
MKPTILLTAFLQNASATTAELSYPLTAELAKSPKILR